MAQEIKTISREAAETSKGYTLQKLRTVSLILEEIEKDNEIDFIAAIEFAGDVYIGKDHYSYIEENKAYESQNFSFASDPIKNTLVYFLDHWLNNERNSNICFGIFCTNNIAKEINSGLVKAIGIDLPENKIIESLQLKDYTDPKTIGAAKQILLNEYKKQYDGNKNVSLANSHYENIQLFSTKDWESFFDKVEWVFSGITIEELEELVLEQIQKTSVTSSPSSRIKAQFIRAELFYQLELRQNKAMTADRFLKKADIENVFYKAIYEEINEGSYKYLNINYDDVRVKTQRFLTEFVNLKYFAITGFRTSPKLFSREVLLIDPNVRSTGHSMNQRHEEYTNSTGPFESFAQSDQPVFLLGDLGSGKSTMAAEYLINKINTSFEVIPIFIPTTHISNSNFLTLEDFKLAINKFVNGELQIEDGSFDIKNLIKARKETVLIVDGLDELELGQTKQIISHLKNLKSENEKIKVIATGRPVELEGVIPAGWKILSTTSLVEKEILSILYNESLSRGNPPQDAEFDAIKKISYLKGSSQIFAIATTPLIICSLYNQLDQNIVKKSLGDILYYALHEKLGWNNTDGKADEFNEFNKLYPSKFAKEPLLGNIAWKMQNQVDKSLTENELYSAVNNYISTIENKGKIVQQAIKFFKNIFLQETTNKKYTFISNPLLECSAALSIADSLKNGEISLDFIRDWRSLSFAGAVLRQRDEVSASRANISKIISKNLTWENHYVPQVAIILAELKDHILSKNFFHLLEKLPYRPLKEESRSDSSSLNSYAVCIDLAEDIGYKWFWKQYIDSSDPLKHYESRLVSQILSNYLIIKDFKLNSNKVADLHNLVPPNIVLNTSFCHDVLPVIATISDFGLAQEQYFRLLANNLVYHPLLKEKAKEILLAKSFHYKNEVLAAVESMCVLRENGSIDAALFWVELNSDGLISKAVLRTILGKITDENFEEYKKVLLNIISEDNLIAYLKYCCLSDDEKIAKSAALFLFLNGEKDFFLIGKHLINSVEWIDAKKLVLTQKINDFVKSQNTSGVEALVQNIPINNHLGIPPAFWNLFIPALQFSVTQYGEEFLKSIKHLSLLILTRQPEIRIAFTNLFKEKIFYKDLVREKMYNLDNQTRYISASLLLAIGAESEYDALEIVISGFSESSTRDEWQTFVLELRYSENVLNNLYQNKHLFTEYSKIFALTLLSRNSFPLKPADTTLLVDGLLGPGYFSDKSGFGFNTKHHITLSQRRYKDILVSYIRNQNLIKAERAAGLLKQFHWEGLDDLTKARINILNAEDDENYFHKITIEEKSLLFEGSNFDNITIEAINYEKDYGKKALLWMFCESVKENTGFDLFFKKLLQKNGTSFRSELDHQYEWLKNISKHYPELKDQLSEVLKEMLRIPTIQENSSDLYAWLKLMENEFCESSNINHSILLDQIPQTDEEVFAALYFRGLYNLDLNHIDYRNVRNFSSNFETEIINPVDQKEMERLLFDLENIPIDLNLKIEDVIIFGTFSSEELEKFQENGPLSAYFATVVKFVRNLTVDVTLFSKSKEIGNGTVDNVRITSHHKKILFKIYQILISEDEHYSLLVNTLLEEMENNSEKNYVEKFFQLLVLGHNFKLEHLIKLFIELDKRTYSLTPDRAKVLTIYLSEKVSRQDSQKCIIVLKQILLKNKNIFEKDGSDRNRNVLCWILSLALLKFEEKISDEARSGFLLGLQSCFLERNSMRRRGYDEKELSFTGGELLENTELLLRKVKPELIRDIIKYGTTTNIPQIRAVAFLLSTIAGANI